MPHTYIDTSNALAALCQKISNSDWVTVDTEFIREKTYFPQLCLLQIANSDIVACIDVMAIKQLEPLFNLLYKSSIVKIFHAAGQDMEIFYHLKGELPTPVFDTQIAAAYLDYGEQISYAELVHQLTGTKLDKAHTRANWAHRPLTPQQIQYAADDVRYLRDIYLDLKQQLSKKDRLTWINHDLDKLCNPDTYYINPEKIWQRVKHCKKLQAHELPILQALAAWRENYAIKIDRPRRWMLADETLIQLCQTKPSTKADLEAIDGVSKNLVNKQSDELLTCIKNAQNLPEEHWPILDLRAPLTGKQKTLLQTLNELIKTKSQQLAINSTLLATRKDLEQLILGKRDIPLLNGWRYEEVGIEALQLLETLGKSTT